MNGFKCMLLVNSAWDLTRAIDNRAPHHSAWRSKALIRNGLISINALATSLGAKVWTPSHALRILPLSSRLKAQLFIYSYEVNHLLWRKIGQNKSRTVLMVSDYIMLFGRLKFKFDDPFTLVILHTSRRVCSCKPGPY